MKTNSAKPKPGTPAGKTCILHVGMHKTGTTSIQKSLAGITKIPDWHYVKIGGYDNLSIPAHAMFATKPEKYHWFAKQGKSTAAIAKTGKAWRNELASYIKNQPANNFVLSGEAISLIDENGIKRLARFLKKYFDTIKVIAYIRPPKSFMSSMAQQRIKLSVVDGFDSLLKPANYKKKLQKFDQLFGRENVEFVKFDPETFIDGCCVKDFCGRIKMPITGSDVIRTNDRMSREACGLLYTYRIYGSGYGIGKKAISSNRVILTALYSIPGGKFSLSDKLLAPVMAREKADIKWMEKRLGQSLAETEPDGEDGIKNEADLLTIKSETCNAFLAAFEKLTGIKPPVQSFGKIVSPQDAANMIGACLQELLKTDKAFFPTGPLKKSPLYKKQPTKPENKNDPSAVSEITTAKDPAKITFKTAFVGWNPFQFLHVQKLAAALPNSCFIIEKKNDKFLEAFSDDIIHNTKIPILIWPSFKMQELDGVFDIIVCQTVFTKIEHFKKTRLVMLQYGYAKEAHNYGPWRSLADVTLTYGAYAARKIAPFCQVIATGNPRYDAWHSSALAASAEAKYRHLLKSDLKTLLYVPTWGDLSSIKAYTNAIAELSGKYNVLIKTHHNTKLLTNNNLDGLAGNILHQVGIDDDILELLHVCDAVISDYSGAIFDALYCGKPIILLNSPIETQFGKGKIDEFSLEYAERSKLGREVNGPAELPAATAEVLTNPDVYIKRAAVLKADLFDGTHNATKLAVDAITRAAAGEFKPSQSQGYIRNEMRELILTKRKLGEIEKQSPKPPSKS